jgi:hypothetical protein
MAEEVPSVEVSPRLMLFVVGAGLGLQIAAHGIVGGIVWEQWCNKGLLHTPHLTVTSRCGRSIALSNYTRYWPVLPSGLAVNYWADWNKPVNFRKDL